MLRCGLDQIGFGRHGPVKQRLDMTVDSTFLLALLQIIWINILLSGDNAVVIALACRSLPPRERRIGIMLGAGAAVLFAKQQRTTPRRIVEETFVALQIALYHQHRRLLTACVPPSEED